MLCSLYLRRRLSLLQRSHLIARSNISPRNYYYTTMAEAQAPTVKTLPLLSRADRDTYARIAEHMDIFHNSFRQTWQILYDVCCSGKRPANMSIRQFLSTGCDFCYHLHMHHSIGA